MLKARWGGTLDLIAKARAPRISSFAQLKSREDIQDSLMAEQRMAQYRYPRFRSTRLSRWPPTVNPSLREVGTLSR